MCNKDFLPYYNSLNEDDKQFWLACTKETLIDHFIGSIKNGEILLNRINKGIEAINVYQNKKTLSVGYQDLKRIRGILQGNEFDLQMFEEYLQELKGDSSNEC